MKRMLSCTLSLASLGTLQVIFYCSTTYRTRLLDDGGALEIHVTLPENVFLPFLIMRGSSACWGERQWERCQRKFSRSVNHSFYVKCETAESLSADSRVSRSRLNDSEVQGHFQKFLAKHNKL